MLAQRLGYTNDDIRNWAAQPDPCMSLLDEWFATHKTREATHAVLKTLQEINRLDAATIVEKALKAVGKAVTFISCICDATCQINMLYYCNKIVPCKLTVKCFDSWIPLSKGFVLKLNRVPCNTHVM